MNFIQRWQDRMVERVIRRRVTEGKALPFTLPTWNRGQPVYPLIDYRSYAGEGYGRNSVVYACIRKIATTAPAASLRVVKMVDGRPEPTKHALHNIFQHPNPFTTAFEFQEILHTFLNLAGECFIVKVDRELYFARPDLMSPVPGDKALLGFIYIGLDGKRVPFLTDDVIHIKYPNPQDIWGGLGRGLSPLSAASIETDVDNNSTAFLRDFFKNAAVPYGLLKSKSVLDQPRIDLIRDRIKNQYSGERKWHEIMIIDADVEYQRLGLAINEMAMPEIRFLTESRICSVFEVPPILVGVQIGLKSEGGFTSAIPEARKALWHDKLIPDNKRIADVFTLAFRDQLADDEVVAHDYGSVQILQEDRTAQFDRANQAWLGGWRTLNETRREIGDPSLDGGDVLRGDMIKEKVIT